MIVSKTTESPTSRFLFPKLMEGSNGLIVLFSASGIGTIVCPENGKGGQGYTSNAWNMSAFSDFSGQVILQNQSENARS